MPPATNAFGLNRKIPAEVRHEVRRRSGHGCVMCRQLLCEYEHIDPPFAEARAHEPENICLLCPNHHELKTRRQLSASQVRSAYARAQTSDLPPFHQLHFSGLLRITLGNSVFEHTPANAPLLEYDSQPLLSVSYVPDDVFGGFRPSMSGRLTDRSGDLLFDIDDNVINFAKNSFDIDAVGPTITIRSGLRRIAIKITLEQPDGVVLNQLVMKHGEVEFNFNRNFGCTVPTRDGRRVMWSMPELESQGATSAISYTSDRSQWHANEFQLHGGRGCMIPDSGLTFAKDSGLMLIKRIAGRIG